MKKYLTSLHSADALFILISSFWYCGIVSSQSSLPIITVRFANPEWSVTTSQYCVDVEFLSDTTDIQVFGVNMRFFYDDGILEFNSFNDFQGGYAAVSPNPPHISTSSAGPELFGFEGPADFVNGAIQLVNTETPIILDTVQWTKLFQICFEVDDPDPNVLSFCPSLVLDMEADPANGGFLVADEGVVVTILDPDPNMESTVTTEHVVQFNWRYIGTGSIPWGEPVEEVCISFGMPLTLSTPPNLSLECTESMDPSVTGFATAMDDCEGEIVITYLDEIVYGECSQEVMLTRIWTATNGCEEMASAVQLITVEDTIPPGFTILPYAWLNRLSADSINLFYLSDTGMLEMLNNLNENSIDVYDQCDPQIIPEFSVISSFAVNCVAEGYAERRIYSWTMTDECGNSAEVHYTVDIMDDVAPVLIGVPEDQQIFCEQLPSVPYVYSDDPAQPVTILVNEIVLEGDQPGTYDVYRRWSAIDACGNSAVEVQHITWRPESLLQCMIDFNKKLACNSDRVIIKSKVIGDTEGVSYFWELIGEGSYIQGGQGTPRLGIHLGNTPVDIILTLTDPYGCQAVCTARIDCSYTAPSFVRNISAIDTSDSLLGMIGLEQSLSYPQQDFAFEAMKAWPNPTTGLIHIRMNARQEGMLHLGIFNLFGQEMKREQVNCQAGLNTWMMDLSDMKDGSYLIRMNTGEEVFTKVIVLLR